MGSTTSATVPALWALCGMPRSETRALKMASAMGLRLMFAVQTKRIFLVASGPIAPLVNPSQPSARVTFLQARFAALPLPARPSRHRIIYRATSSYPTNRVSHPEVHSMSLSFGSPCITQSSSW